MSLSMVSIPGHESVQEITDAFQWSCGYFGSLKELFERSLIYNQTDISDELE